MSEMVDRVAMVLDAVYHEPWPGFDARAMARLAISAMREATQEQYDALCATDKVWRDLDSKTVWQTYIDAALGTLKRPMSYQELLDVMDEIAAKGDVRPSSLGRADPDPDQTIRFSP
jgi:hypothetical protein